MAEIIGYIGRAQTLSAELSSPQTLTASFCGGGTAHGIPAGGEPGQGLIKVSDADYDVKWMDILPEDTASGAVASFPDGSDDLPMGVVIDIDPVQDLHGYDSPWPGGGGKNILDPRIKWTSGTYYGLTFTTTDGYHFKYTGTATGSGNIITSAVNSSDAIILPAGTYISRAAIASIYKADGTWFRNQYSNTPFTVDEPFYVRNFYVQIVEGRTYDIENTLELVKGSTLPSSWTPYSNICPISGWTGAKVTRTGKNLIEISFNQINASNVLSNVFELKAGTYTLSFNYNGTPTWGVYLRNGTTASSPVIKLAYNANNLTFTLDKDYQELCISVYYANGISVSEVTNAQIERGSTAHAYEPYQGVTHEIPFSTSVYGGKLNVETGECVVEYAKKTITAFSGIWGIQSSGVFAVYAAIPDTTHIQTDMKISKMKSNIFKYTQADRSTAPLYGYGGNDGGNTTQTFILPNTITSLAEANAWLANNPTECTFKLATPITLTLDPVEIRSLFGDNNVFADTGNTTVTYKADIQKYIDKKISAAVAAMS